jgi:phenylacetate-CoA ligase
LHVNPLNALVEILLPDGSPAPPGVPGQVVVTDMLNWTMPLIRYRIGDVAAMLAVGKLRLPRLEIVAGRETDFVVTPDDRFVSGASLTLISAPGIAQLQYVQSLDGRLTVNYVKTSDCTSVDVQELRSKISAVV